MLTANMNHHVTVSLRLFQLSFSAIIIIISVYLFNGMGPVFAGYMVHNPPGVITYGAFCGGAGLIFALAGGAAVLFVRVPELISLAFDGFAALLFLTAGIAFAAMIKAGNCGINNYTLKNPTFYPTIPKNYGYDPSNKNKDRYTKDIDNDVVNRCRMMQTETAFLWFAFACFVATAALGWMTRRRNSSY